ncbi:MAG: CHRD domain-containing protein, partial [Acidobacteria bacterium]|nr:CHRD domain-containing protein [Acidobacteriota bacterium]
MWNLCALRLKLIGSIVALCLLTAVSAQAETLYALVRISPANEVPPITTLDATGGMLVIIDVQRNSVGAITGARMSFLGTVQFPGNVIVQGLHIHEGVAGVNGPVRFDTGLNANTTLVFANGAGVVQRDVATVNLEALGRLLANPAGWYVNLHTSVNPGGALRAQLTRFSENLAMTTALSTANEVPPITTQNAFGSATITVNPTRNAAGAVTGGSVNFTVGYDLPPNAVVRGLHIHEGPAGVNAGVVIDTGLSAANNFVTAAGRGIYSSTLLLTTPASIGAMMRLLVNPTNFYVNLHTNDFPGGVIRGQLGGSFNPAPQIAQVSTYNLLTGNTGSLVTALAANLDPASEPLVNGEPTQFTFNPATGLITLLVPANLLTEAGVVALQIRNGNGLISQPVFIPVATNGGSTAAVLDSAGYGNVIAPESIASVYGVNLATQTAIAGAILPNAIGGTSVYVNGAAAPLFFVSPGQINFQVPEGTVPGPAAIVVRNSNGAIARSLINVGTTGAGIFTRLANGKGAPAAVASTDNGQTYALLMSNADGTPVEIQVGNIAVFFGTGFRFLSNRPITAAAGGVNLTTDLAGAQGAIVGLDQINLIIPESLRGKGEVDLVFT